MAESFYRIIVEVDLRDLEVGSGHGCAGYSVAMILGTHEYFSEL